MKVVYGLITAGQVEAETMDSLVATLIRDQRRNKHLTGRLLQFSSANISRARNHIARNFLTNYDADWLWIFDSDMTWQPDALDQILTVADPTKAPIVSALCFQLATRGMDDLYVRNRYVSPTMFTFDDSQQLTQIGDYPDNTMVQCAAVGTGFLIIHREVLEKMAAEYPEPMPWFAESIHGDRVYGEDVTFSLRASLLGIPIFTHTGVKTGHKKQWVVTETDYTPLTDTWEEEVNADAPDAA